MGVLRLTNNKEQSKLIRDQKGNIKALNVTKEEFLKLRPVISPNVKILKRTDVEMLLEIDIQEIKKKSLIKRLFPTPNTRKIMLDRLGMDVFKRCDGNHRIKDIFQEFQDEFKLTPTEVEVSVQQYILSLTERHIIGFLIPKEIVGKEKLKDGAIDKILIDPNR
ncbi:MAG: PqqD family protein [Candidatus Heimdallarchaeota archaeon]|nr:PqqD family protein [Candidatus Heimdallarchaeota archaeon]